MTDRSRPRTMERSMQTRNLLAAMASLQALWLVTIWVTGIASDPRKLPSLVVYTVVIGVAIGCMPARFVHRIAGLKERLTLNEKRLILILCLVVLTIGVVYASSQRVLTDERRVFDASRIVTEQGVAPFFADYAGIPWLGRQHPPLIPLVYGLTMRILGMNVLVIRLVSLASGIGAILLTYLVGRELYDGETGLVGALALLSFPYFVRMGASALTDMPLTFFFVLGLYLILCLRRRQVWRLSVAAGMVIGAGLLSKYTMALIYPILLSYFATNASFRRLKLHLGIVSLVSFGMLATWLVYAYHSGILEGQSKTIVSYAGLVTTSSSGKRWMLEMVSTRLTAALGLYNMPMLLLGALDLMRRRSEADLLVLLWIAAVFLVVLLTLPDARYFMPAFPALAIALVCGLENLSRGAERAVLLALLYCGGALYLFVDWYRAGYLFLR